jgi:cytochrome c oxidase subunit 1
MSSTGTIDGQLVENHSHDHHENFITKYIFTTDHKMIGKQFLITGIAWALIGGALSLIFRLQLGFPEAQLEWLPPDTRRMDNRRG